MNRLKLPLLKKINLGIIKYEIKIFQLDNGKYFHNKDTAKKIKYFLILLLSR